MVPPVVPVPATSLAPAWSFAPSLSPMVFRLPTDASAGPRFSSSFGGGGGGTSRTDFMDVPGALGALFKFADPLLFQDGDELYDKGDKESPSLGRSGLSPVFRQVVSLITGFFPAAKPTDSSAVDMSPWFDDFGSSRRRGPRVFLFLFDKLSPVKRDIEDKFQKAADDKKKATSALPTWGDVYRLGDLPDFFKAPKINESFSRLLGHPVSISCYVSLSLEESAKLEICFAA